MTNSTLIRKTTLSDKIDDNLVFDVLTEEYPRRA
jgi:hypothetical protein